MANLFQASEIVNIGIEDEITGAALYSALAEATDNPDLKSFYQAMAEKERVHERKFRDLLRGLDSHEIHRSYPGEYEAYLRALLDARAFPNPEVAKQKVSGAADDRSRLLLALQMEKDTLTLFLEIVHLIPQRHRPTVQTIIDEERSHVVELSEQLAKLG